MTTDWSFKNKAIGQNFDSHVREQLPWYDLATEAAAMLIRAYLPQGGVVYDIGASTGNIGRSIAGILPQRNASLFAVEESQDMCENYNGGGALICNDASNIEYQPFDVGVCFLSLMFMSKQKRKGLLDSLLGKMNLGGCLIVVEKFDPESGYLATVLRRMTLEWKLKNGAEPSAILEKELALTGVQRTLELKELPINAQEFFRMGEFRGYIIEKH